MLNSIFHFVGVVTTVIICGILLLLTVSFLFKWFRYNISKRTPMISAFHNTWIARKRLIKTTRRLVIIIEDLEKNDAPSGLMDIAEEHREAINKSIDSCDLLLSGLLRDNSVKGLINKYNDQEFRKKAKSTE